MATSNGRLPRSFGLFLGVLALLILREAFHLVTTGYVERAIVAQRDLTAVEHAVVFADAWVFRMYPFAVIPVLLAPATAIVAWALRVKRSTGWPENALAARAHLRVWAIMLAGAAVLFGAIAPLWGTRWATTILLCAVLAFWWATAGTLFTGLWLQTCRNRSGASGIRASSLAILSFALACLVPFASAIVPLWVLWSSRYEIRSKTQPAG